MIIFLYGEDTFRSRRKLKELKDKFIREVDPRGTSLSVLDGEKVTMGRINEAIGSASLLSSKRMVVIENLLNRKDAEVIEQFYQYLKNKEQNNTDNIIVIWEEAVGGQKISGKSKQQLFKFLSGQKYAQEFKAMSNTEVMSWAKKEIESRGAQIGREALAHLAALTGNDLWQLDQEMEKLINFKSAQKLDLGDSAVKIELADVQNLVQGTFDESIFALMDAISNRNRSAAVKLFEGQLEGGKSADYLLNMITRQVKILLQVRQALDSGFTSRKIISDLKLHPFVAQKSITQVRNFNLTSLKNILERLIQIDYQMKSGKVDVTTALDLLIAKL